MKRIDTSTRAIDKHGPGKDGFTNGVPGVTPTTELDESWFDNVQEGIAGVVESTGQVLDGLDFTQLDKAIRFYQRRMTALNISLARSTAAGQLLAVAGSTTTPGTVVGGTGGIVHTRSPTTGQWTLQTTPSAADVVDGAYDEVDDRYIFVANIGGAPQTFVGTSDGSSWALGGSGLSNLPDTVNGIAFGVGFAGARPWIAVGAGSGGDGEYSELVDDGSAGTVFAAPSATGQALNGVAVRDNGSGVYVMVGDGGYVATGTLMSTTTVRTSGTTEDLQDVTWSDYLNAWVAVGDNGTILTSADGITWAAQTSPFSGASWVSIEGTSDCLVLVGSSGSTDLVYAGAPGAWKRSIDPVIVDPRRVRFVGGGQFLFASGDNGDAYQSLIA